MALYRRLLTYLAPYRWGVAAAVLASTVAATAAGAYAFLVGPLLKAVLTDAPIELGPIPLSPSLRAQPLLLPSLIIAAAAVKALAQFLHGGLMQSTGQRVLADLRRALYQNLLAQPPQWFTKRHSGELLSRFTADVAQVEFAVTAALSSYAKDSLQVLALLGVCLAIDWRLFLLSFVVLPVAVLPVSRFAKALKKVAVRTQSSLGQLTELLAEQLHNLPVVLAYRAEPRALARFDAEQERYLVAMRRSLFIRGAFTPTLELLGVAGAALAIGYGAFAVGEDPALAGKLLSFMTAALLMYQPLKALSQTASLVSQGVGAAGRLFEVVDAPVAADAGRAAAPLCRELVFEDVRVSYDGERAVLRGVALRVPAGRRVALVGASGAGKSTLVAAVLRFVELSGGRIVWDGQDVAELSASSLRAQLAWVPQEPVLFSGTVRHNLLLGRPEASDAELWKALEAAHADAFVRAMGGLDAAVGERGGQLSGGQRQRLAIARAFVRRPSVLLLDEPTSALDAQSEQGVHEGLAELMRGRTTLVIAHRLATVRDADLIYVLGEGTVREVGTHAELLARGNEYARLVAAAELREV